MHIFKSYTIIFLLFGVVLLNWNCVPEDETTRQQTDVFYLIAPLPDTVFFRGQNVLSFEIKTSDGLDADKIDEVIFYKSLERPVVLGSEETIRGEETILAVTSQIPGEITFDIGQLLQGTGYNSESEIPPGAFWNIRWEVTSLGKTLAPVDTTEIKYQCLSNLAGRYSATNDFCATSPLLINIIADTVSGDQNKYIVPDFTANVVAECEGAGVLLSTTITEACGNIAPRSRTFASRNWNITGGSWNEQNGTLLIFWINPLNGQSVTSTFVRQE